MASEGEWQKTFTMITIIIHFVHPLLCVANYLDWVRYQRDELGDRSVNLYLAATIIATLMYLLVASVFYMWAYRWPLPEEYAQKRRIYGVIVNLIFSDVPMFAIEVDIVWEVGFASGIQATCFLFTCLSFAYSGIRTWIYLMITVIKATRPQHQLGGVPMASGPYAAHGYQAAPQYAGPHDLDLRQRHDVAVPPAMHGGISTHQIANRGPSGGSSYASPLDYSGGGAAPGGPGVAAGGIIPQPRY